MSEPLIPDAVYLTLADADSLAAMLPELSAYKAATDDAREAALRQATLDVDAAMPYQGRRYDPDQPREFPRRDADSVHVAASTASIWDWDADTAAAIVPPAVRRATLWQADAILAGVREPRLSAQHDGVVYVQTETTAESYKSAPGVGLPTGLCRRAWLLLRRYRLKGGSLL